MNLKHLVSLKMKRGDLSEMIQELRWIYGYGLKYRKHILGYICLGIIGTIMGLAGSVIGKHIIDAVTGYNASGLKVSIVAYAFFQTFIVGIRALERKVSAQIEIKVDQEIQAEIFGRIMETDWEALSEFHSGDLLNRVDNDVSNVSASVIGWLPELVTRGFQFVGTFAVIMYYDTTLAFLALLSAPATLLVSRTLTKRLRTYHEEICRTNSEVMIFQEESFRNSQLIKAFGIGGLYQEKLAQAQEKHRKIKLEYQNFAIKSNLCMSMMGLLVSGLCLGWGIYRLWAGYITFGTMTLFLQLAGMVRGSFSALVYMVPKAISVATAAGRLMAIEALPKENIQFQKEAEELIQKNNGITIRGEHITFQYKSGKEVILHSDFAADPGEIIVLMGSSGEGKTTLLRVLLGMVTVCEGRLEIGDKNGGIQIPISAATRGLFSYVPQDNVMFFDTIAENMRIVKKDATEEEITDALRQACAYDFVKALPEGIYSKIGEDGTGFSEGQIQRLAIARALLSQAPIILLDEATSALDVATEQKLLHNLMEKNPNRTLIFVTHRPSVLPMCDKVYRIDRKMLRVMTQEETERLLAGNDYECDS